MPKVSLTHVEIHFVVYKESKHSQGIREIFRNTIHYLLVTIKQSTYPYLSSHQRINTLEKTKLKKGGGEWESHMHILKQLFLMWILWGFPSKTTVIRCNKKHCTNVCHYPIFIVSSGVPKQTKIQNSCKTDNIVIR